MKHFNCKVNALGFKGKTDYTKRTDSRKIAININGKTVYSSPLMSKGNMKIDKAVLIFDLLAVYTCPNCAECRKDCYALKAQRQYADTWNKRYINTWLAVNALNVLEGLLVDQLTKDARTAVRVHSSGDFFSQSYVDMWLRIARKFPSKVFYAYTKTTEIFNFDLPSNFNIVNSCLPDGSVNFGDMAFIEHARKEFKCHVCGCGINPETKCGKTCTACQTEKYVIFLKH